VNGRPAKANDPRTWTSFATAYAACQRGGCDGIGYVPTASDPFTFLDLDHVVDPASGAMVPWSDTLRERFAGEVPEPAVLVTKLDSYAELSPSGTGARVIVQGKLPKGKRKIGGKGNGCSDGLELYDEAHYLTITGQRLPASPATIQERTEVLHRLHTLVFGVPRPASAPPTSTGTAPINLYLEDALLIAKASDARGGEKFRRLWAGDASGYASRSEADFALAGRLAFWVGPFPDRIERLMRQSGLVRHKWDKGHYLARTIEKALQGRTEFYDPTRIGCGSVADGLHCDDSTLQPCLEVRTKRHKTTYPQRIRKAWETNPWDCSAVFGVAARKDASPALLPAACGRRDCPICGPRWKLKNYRRFHEHIMAHDGELYWGAVADYDWRAVATDMRRQAKKLGIPLRYVTLRGGDEITLTVIASVPVGAFAKPIRKPEALMLLEEAIDTAAVGPRPISASRQWGVLHEEDVEITKVGGGCSLRSFKVVLEAWGSTAQGRRAILAQTKGLFLDSDGRLDEAREAAFWSDCRRLDCSSPLTDWRMSEADHSPSSGLNPTRCQHDYQDLPTGDGRARRVCLKCGDFYGYVREQRE